MTQLVLKASDIKKLLDNLLKVNYQVVAPVKEGNTALYKYLDSADEVYIEMILPNNSIKEFFLPRYEPVLSYQRKKHEVESKGTTNYELRTTHPLTVPTVIFGTRPCDAASLPIMDKVFAWDYQDSFWQDRRKNTTVITIACTTCDNFAFCTSVGTGPESRDGSDIYLQASKDKSGYLVEGVTDKGKKLLDNQKGVFSEANPEAQKYSGPAKQFELNKIKPWLDKNFDHPSWQEMTRHCIGCATCTFLCPTCHCFDIVDEPTNLEKGTRYKNWDACQLAIFTVHASGHNPRDTQDKRYRQRVMHKFSYYPEKFDKTLCVGCGRCIRHCPVDMSLLQVIKQIDKM